MPSLRYFLRQLFALGVFSLVCSTTHAQISTIGDDTSVPIPGAGHDYIKMLDETVNPANGSLSLRIQIPVPAGRGFTLPFSINYDTSGTLHLLQGAPGQAFWQSNVAY